MIAVIDYGLGNVKSLINAIEYLGYDVILTRDETKLQDASKIILPGVGSFSDGIKEIKEKGLDEILYRQVIEQKKLFLGICLGMQLIATESHEHGFHQGFGWVNASVVRFEKNLNVKIPHMGWNDVSWKEENPLFFKVPINDRAFYFVHSYHLKCNGENDVLATCYYGKEFVASVHNENIYAVQFHPEKSQDNGLRLLQNFIELND